MTKFVMKRMRWRSLLFVLIVLVAAVCCKKKTLSRGSFPPGTLDSIPVVPVQPGGLAYTQVAKHISMGADIGGFYEALPPFYDTSSNRYPLLVFLHGGGELGNGDDQLPLVLKNAIPALLGNKSFPLSFDVSGHKSSFIILSPQFREWPKPADVDDVISYALDHYRVDTHRVYMVGLSMGGGATWEYAAKHGNRLAAMVPISGASWADSATAKGIADANVPTWAFHNMDDSAVTYKSTTRYISFIKYYNPEFPLTFTLWATGGHDAWTKATDPSYRENGKNIYEWMLQYAR